MKIYVFEGSYMLEIIAANSEDEAWEFLTTHPGTSSNGGTLEFLKTQWEITIVYNPSDSLEPFCVGHYSG